MCRKRVSSEFLSAVSNVGGGGEGGCWGLVFFFIVLRFLVDWLVFWFGFVVCGVWLVGWFGLLICLFVFCLF